MTAAGSARSIVLVGLMGTGKSSVARLLGEQLGLEIRDTDRMVESATGKRVRDLFAEDGEDAFRDLESRELEKCLDSDEPAVVAAAGGVVLREKNRVALNEARRRGRAFVVWLTADVADLVERTRRGAHRPLLDSDPGVALDRMAETRREMYASVCDVVIHTSGLSLGRVAQAIIAAESHHRIDGAQPARIDGDGVTHGNDADGQD